MSEFKGTKEYVASADAIAGKMDFIPSHLKYATMKFIITKIIKSHLRLFFEVRKLISLTAQTIFATIPAKAPKNPKCNPHTISAISLNLSAFFIFFLAKLKQRRAIPIKPKPCIINSLIVSVIKLKLLLLFVP